MAFQKQYSKSTTSSARPSNGGATEGKMVGKDGKEFDTSTTHYLKDTEKQFVDNIQIWENSGEYGSYLKINILETLKPGTYFMTAKKGHTSKITAA